MVTREGIFDRSFSYDSNGVQTAVNLLPGNYELRYNFSSTEAVTTFYVYVDDPDGNEITHVFGPPTPYNNQTAQLEFEALKTGQHTFRFGGTWVSVQVYLFRLTQSSGTVYPYIIVLYLGLVLFVFGAVVGILGTVMKEKSPPQWFDVKVDNKE